MIIFKNFKDVGIIFQTIYFIFEEFDEKYHERRLILHSLPL